jgi:hypothetical protein
LNPSGLNYCDLNNIDFVSKIDTNLQFYTSYFEKTGAAFYENPKLGIAGGIIKEFRNGSWS